MSCLGWPALKFALGWPLSSGLLSKERHFLNLKVAEVYNLQTCKWDFTIMHHVYLLRENKGVSFNLMKNQSFRVSLICEINNKPVYLEIKTIPCSNRFEKSCLLIISQIKPDFSFHSAPTPSTVQNINKYIILFHSVIFAHRLCAFESQLQINYCKFLELTRHC